MRRSSSFFNPFNAGGPPFPDEEIEEEEPDALHPSPWRVISQAALLCYDYLGLALAASLALFFLLLFLWLILPPQRFGPTPILQVVRLGLLCSPAYALMAGGALLARRMRDREEPRLFSLMKEWKRYAGPAAATGAMQGFLGAVLAGDMVFFFTRPEPLARYAALPFLYLLFFWASAQLYALPLLLEGLPPTRAFVQSLLLTLANPVFSAVLGLVALMLAGISLLIWIPLAFVLPMALLCLGDLAFRALLRKYQALEGVSDEGQEQ